MSTWQTTGIGSLPFQSSSEAVEYVFKSYTIPFFPQLIKNERYAKSNLPPMLLEAVPQAILTLFSDKSSALDKADQLQAMWDKEILAHVESLPGLTEFARTISGYKGNYYKLQLIGPQTAIQLLETLCGRTLNSALKKIVRSGLSDLMRQVLDRCNVTSKQAIIMSDEPLVSAFNLKNHQQADGVIHGTHCCAHLSLSKQLNYFKNKYLSFDLTEISSTPDVFEAISLLQKTGGVMLGIADTKQKILNASQSRDLWQQLNQNLSVDETRLHSMPLILTGGCGTGMQSIAFEKQLSALLNELK